MKVMHELCSVLLLLLLSLVGHAAGICYFPAVYQGEYESQTVGGSTDVSYSSISVLYDSIPVWGYCYKRVGSNVILKEDSGGITCFRCFHLSLRSSNILRRRRERPLAPLLSEAEILTRPPRVDTVLCIGSKCLKT